MPRITIPYEEWESMHKGSETMKKIAQENYRPDMSKRYIKSAKPSLGGFVGYLGQKLWKGKKKIDRSVSRATDIRGAKAWAGSVGRNYRTLANISETKEWTPEKMQMVDKLHLMNRKRRTK